jgi:TDG/mug DNA glycosylase family protein
LAASPKKPTPAEIAAARGRTVPDIIAPGLRVLFVGINPSLYSAAVGHHFARPGNRFWPTLHAARFTDCLLHPSEGRLLLARGYGISNIADPATATADELSDEELRAGARRLARKVKRYRPAVVAFLGVTAYRTAFGRPGAKLGRQDERIGDSVVWVLPNPSGLNAHYQLAGLAALYADLRRATDRTTPSSTSPSTTASAARLTARPRRYDAGSKAKTTSHVPSGNSTARKR